MNPKLFHELLYTDRPSGANSKGQVFIDWIIAYIKKNRLDDYRKEPYDWKQKMEYLKQLFANS